MSESQIDIPVAKYPCPLGKEKCPGPIVRKEGDKTFLICSQVIEAKSVSEQVIKECGDQFPVMLFTSFMLSERKK